MSDSRKFKTKKIINRIILNVQSIMMISWIYLLFTLHPSFYDNNGVSRICTKLAILALFTDINFSGV